MTSIKGRHVRRIMDERGYSSIIVDLSFIASDKWMQKVGHCIILCSLCTSDLYNMI